MFGFGGPSLPSWPTRHEFLAADPDTRRARTTDGRLDSPFLQTRDDVFGQDAPQTMAGFPRFRQTFARHRIMLLLTSEERSAPEGRKPKVFSRSALCRIEQGNRVHLEHADRPSVERGKPRNNR